jgi:CheY-like chemotaxis protein
VKTLLASLLEPFGADEAWLLGVEGADGTASVLLGLGEAVPVARVLLPRSVRDLPHGAVRTSHDGGQPVRLPSALAAALPSLPPAGAPRNAAPATLAAWRSTGGDAVLLLAWQQAVVAVDALEQALARLAAPLEELARLARRAEQLEAARDRLQRTLHGLPNGVVLVDGARGDACLNAAARAVLRLSRDTVSVADLAAARAARRGESSPVDRDDLEDALGPRQGDGREHEVWALPDSGADALDGHRWWRLDEMSLDAADHAMRLWHLVDITARVRTARERRGSHARQRHLQASEAVSRLSAGVAHDFTNLLAVVRGSLDLVADAPVADAGDVRRAIEAADRAADLTSRLLAFSRLDLHQPAAHRLDEMVRHVMTRLLGRDEAARLRLDLATAGAWVFVDPEQLRLALLSLVRSALEATAGHHATVVVRTRRRHTHPLTETNGRSPQRHWVGVVIEDDADPLPAHLLDRLRDPLLEDRPVALGNGLQLAVASILVHRAGGFFEVEREDAPPARSRGVNRVTAWLPTMLGVPDLETSVPEARVEPGASRRVLVVDDESGVREVLARLLERAGHQAVLAGDGPAALDLLERGEPFDVIVSDHAMPGMSGRELLEWVATAFPRVRRVLMSGFADDEHVRASLAATGARLLPKPFTLAAVRHALEG